jgi:hypothetical protein
MNRSLFIPKTLAGKTALFCALFLIIYQFLYGFSPSVISWDTFGYYLYLPQSIIHGDLGMENYETVANALASPNVDSATFYQAAKADTGNWVIKYPMGLAFLYLPFFLIALLIAWIGGYPMDGFSEPFQHAMTFGSLFYMVLGIWLLKKILTYFFKDNIAAITLLIVIFATNYFHIHTRSHCMPHVYLFTGYAALIWLTICWNNKRTLKNAVGIGFTLGLMTISRPTELIAVLIPALYGITSIRHIFSRLKNVFKWWKHFLVAGIVFAIVLFPQLLYWYVYAGKWLYNSYQNAGEGLDFLTPYTVDFLFSYRKGWLIYTPVMFLAILGMIRGFKSKQKWWWSVVIFSAMYIYVVSCWTTWWYAASFSQRTMVQVYPVMAIAIGGVLTVVWKHKVRRMLVFAFGLFCLLLSTFQTWQYNQGIIHNSRMTGTYYWKVFGELSIPEGAEKYLLINRSTGPTDFMENPEEYYIHSSSFLVLKDGYLRYSAEERSYDELVLPGAYSMKFESSFDQICTKDHAWISLNGKIKADSTQNLSGLRCITTFSHKWKSYKIQDRPVIEHIRWNPQGYFDFEIMYLTPEVRNGKDPFQFYMINTSTEDSIVLSDFKMVVFQRKDVFD